MSGTEVGQRFAVIPDVVDDEATMIFLALSGSMMLIICRTQ